MTKFPRKVERPCPVSRKAHTLIKDVEYDCPHCKTPLCVYKGFHLATNTSGDIGFCSGIMSLSKQPPMTVKNQKTGK